MNFFNKLSSIRTKMLIAFIPIILLATVSIAAASVLKTKAGLEEQIEARVTEALNTIEASIESEFTTNRQIAEAVAAVYEVQANTLTKTDYRGIIEKFLAMNKNTLGSGLWLESGVYDKNIRYFGPYLHKEGETIVYSEAYESEDYDYFNTDWYLIGKNTEKGVGWTDPYYDEVTKISMVTAAVPISTEYGIIGVASADYDLTTIQKIIKEVKLGESGYAFLIDTKGRFIAHKDPQKVMKLAIEQDQELGVIADTIMNNSEGSINVALGGQDFRADYLTLASTGWKLVVMTPFAELFSSVSDMIANAIMITLIIIALTVGLIIIYSTSFSREFKQFVDSLGFVAQGDFTRAIEVKTKDEIGQMGAYYNHVLVELRNMVDTIKEKEQHIQFLADRDPMTELYNRRKFNELLTRDLLNNVHGNIVLLDIDNFKTINDTLGHNYGDHLLRYVAEILREKMCCDNTIPFRLGGDEFLIWHRNQSEKCDVRHCMEVTMAKLREKINIEGVVIHITVSAGIAAYPADGRTVDELLVKADIAMYSAKNNGKNRCMMFDEQMTSAFHERFKIEKILREALEYQRFRLLYQPVVDAQTGAIAYFEALIRIQDSSLSPAVFIQVAEESGLIIPIGRWVIQEAICQQRKWIDANYPVKGIAINISGNQFYDENLVAYIANSLDEQKVDPALIEIEITESVLIDNKEKAINIMKKLEEMGIRIALDDFGTGFSSLNYLAFMPVDKIKLDKSLKDKFIRMESIQVMEGIVSVAHGLGLMVVAEGVEEEVEANRLKRVKCNYLQGYLYSRPLRSNDVERLLKTQTNLFGFTERVL